MTTAIAPSTEQASAAAATQAALTRAATTSASVYTASANAQRMANQAIAKAMGQPLPGTDPMDFIRDNRIHVAAMRNDPRFIDAYLVLHPHELRPENEAKLRKKLTTTFTVNNPSFYESRARLRIAMALAQLVPVSLEAKHSALTTAISNYNAQADTGIDANLKKQLDDRLNPFAAIVRDTIAQPEADPVGIAMLKNGIGIYMLMREKLTQVGERGNLSDYISPPAQSVDQVLGDLSKKIGVTPLEVRKAAFKGGIDGVGQLLGLSPAYVADVKQMTEYAATQDFGFNVIEHWHQGRQILNDPTASLEKKITTGLAARIENTIRSTREKFKNLYPDFELPAHIRAEEKRIAESLNLLEPIQRALMFKLGYEICYTDENHADPIAFYNGIWGLHRRTAKNLNDMNGTNRVYLSAAGDLKNAMRVMVHEVAHNLWPDQFSVEETAKIDALARSDQQRFAALNRIMDEKFPEFETFLHDYQNAGSNAVKAEIAARAKVAFASYGVSIDEGLLPYLRDANDFRYLVKHAHEKLSIDGSFFAKAGYDNPQSCMREVISRFAELKQVELKGEPQLLHYLAPGLDQIWEAHYIPHLKHVYQILAAKQAGNAHAASADAPKVDQRPTAQAASTDACADSATPTTQIDTNTITAAPAFQALSAMGITPH